MSRLQIQGKIPFQEAESHDTEECVINPDSCALYRMLPANAKEYARNYPHLLEYPIYFRLMNLEFLCSFLS